MSYIFSLEKLGGFCWQYWVIAEHYLEAKKRGHTFYLEDTHFLFKHNKGWRDYFVSLNLYNPSIVLEEPIYIKSAHNVFDPNLQPKSSTLNEYRDCFKEMIAYTPELNEKIKNSYTRFSLNEGQYGACMIRRGDKMFQESIYIPTEFYLDALIQKNIDTIFIQTDDYQVYLDALGYVDQVHKDKNVRLLTLCPPWKQGTICYKNEYNMIHSRQSEAINPHYVQSLLNRFKKTVDEFSPSEMKEHVEEMLIGFDICLHSKYLALDLQSNVTRYLFVSHDCPENVISIDGPAPSFDIPLPRGDFPKQ